MDFSQTFSPPSPTTLSYNSMSLEPPSGWSSKKKNNGVSSYTLHTQGFLFLVPLVRQTRFRYLHHLLVHRHNVVTNIVTTAAQIHNWGWPTRQSQERQKEKKAKNEDSRPPQLTVGSQGSLSPILWPERVGFLLEFWVPTRISKFCDSDLQATLISSPETQEEKKKRNIPGTGHSSSFDCYCLLTRVIR